MLSDHPPIHPLRRYPIVIQLFVAPGQLAWPGLPPLVFLPWEEHSTHLPCQWNRSSSTGPTLTPRGGFFDNSTNSLWMRLRAMVKGKKENGGKRRSQAPFMDTKLPSRVRLLPSFSRESLQWLPENYSPASRESSRSSRAICPRVSYAIPSTTAARALPPVNTHSPTFSKLLTKLTKHMLSFVEIKGSKDTPYEDGAFKIDIQVTARLAFRSLNRCLACSFYILNYLSIHKLVS